MGSKPTQTIAANVGKNIIDMKVNYKYIFLCFSFLIFNPKIKAQIQIDTIGLIKTKTKPDEKLEYKILNGQFLFSKEEILKLLCTQINIVELQQLTQNDEWSSRNLKYKLADYQMSYEVLTSNQNIIFENPWDNELIGHRDYDKLSKVHKTSIILNEIFCHMIDSGDFKLKISDKQINKLLKLVEVRKEKGSNSETEIYMTADNIKVWDCLTYKVIE